MALVRVTRLSRSKLKPITIPFSTIVIVILLGIVTPPIVIAVIEGGQRKHGILIGLT